MRKWLAILCMICLAAVPTVGYAMDARDAGGGMPPGVPVGAPVPVQMTRAEFAACCQAAAEAYRAAQKVQPITHDARLAANLTLEKALKTGIVDRILRRFWPGGWPSGGVQIGR